MKTLKMKRITQALGLMGIVMMAALITNPVYAQTQAAVTASVVDQQLTVKGKVSDDKGPLLGVNIVLKGGKVGTVTDQNGAFTFPRALNPGDTLIFSFLGYEKQEIKIDAETTFINLILSSDLVEIMGAVSTDKPYKSKRSKN
ncbi:carboxypeptidase-like regulatory domain-containing protein [uncultured Psychroserpens sp.]|uniref:carboxypeptidase-like regulatory domain-containing protein n=1 Tax=uncultured Psychroserpens sp. TaxID=255436 RepID=UPI002638B0D3|nr:carboxypeptidase-like regulatory domain-containing protein [uncultured Psychroserpens sp.]